MKVFKIIASAAVAAAGLAMLASAPAFAQNSRVVSATVSGGGNMTRQEIRNATFFLAGQLCNEVYGNSRPAQMLGISASAPLPSGNRFFTAQWRCS